MQDGKRGAYLISSSGNPATGGGWIKQQLLKDCGLVPYLLHKNHGFRSVMVSVEIEPDIKDFIDKYVPGLEIDYLPEDTTKARLEYINRHATDMDLLILYGAYSVYIPVVKHYKRVRPDGKIYLAADMNIAWADRLSHEDPDYKNFIQSCDVIAVNCRAIQKYLNAKWSCPINLIRNGCYNLEKVFSNSMFNQKENIILTVARIGVPQKQNNVMMTAFAKVAHELPDWKLQLVGPIFDGFKPFIEKFFEARPDLRERVIFTGNIDDKAVLMEHYKRAKVFCLSSNMESSPHVVAEALFNGCFIVMSDIDAAPDMTDDGNCGRTFPIGDVTTLAKTFREVCRDDDLILTGGRHALSYARKQFDANKIIARLNYLLYGGDAT